MTHVPPPEAENPRADRPGSGRKTDGLSRPLPKRFYKTVATEDLDGAFTLTLDGRPARTPLKRPLAVPNRDLANGLVAEWLAQGSVIDPATMPITRLVTTAIDAVAGREPVVRDEIVRYAGTDLICYRAEAPDGLVGRQTLTWDPVTTWAQRTFGATFVVTQGLTHVAQPEPTTAQMAAAVAPFSALSLAALHTLTTLTGSALLALAVAHGQLSYEAAWQAAHIDEDWQIEQWGSDAEAEARRAFRHREGSAAARVLASIGVG